MSMRRWRRSPHFVAFAFVAPVAGVDVLAGKSPRPVVVVVVALGIRHRKSNGV
jgi:hypothetical protein